jgi:hypothetical protein
MANQGAIPKTPKSSRPKKDNTPRKSSLNIRSEQNYDCCVLCKKEELNIDYRRRLFDDNLAKTKSCERIENTIGLNIDFIFQAGIVCRACDRRILRLSTQEKESDQFKKICKENYELSMSRFISKHGTETSKRLLLVSPEKPTKKTACKQLFDDVKNTSEPDVSQVSVSIISLCMNLTKCTMNLENVC